MAVAVRLPALHSKSTIAQRHRLLFFHLGYSLRQFSADRQGRLADWHNFLHKQSKSKPHLQHQFFHYHPHPHKKLAMLQKNADKYPHSCENCRLAQKLKLPAPETWFRNCPAYRQRCETESAAFRKGRFSNTNQPFRQYNCCQ